jgi:hypothetical protein
VLPGLPSGTRIHSIALGSHSDQALLQTISASTGGYYAFSPSELELHEIYNFTRAAASDEELAMNETAQFPTNESGASLIIRQAIIESGITQVTFSVSWGNSLGDLEVYLPAPESPLMDLSRLRQMNGVACKTLKMRRPQPGAWKLEIRRPAGSSIPSCTIAVFLRSNLKLRLSPGAGTFLAGQPAILLVHVLEESRPIKQYRHNALVSHPIGSIASIRQAWNKRLPTLSVAQLKAPDALPRSVLQTLVGHLPSAVALGDCSISG